GSPAGGRGDGQMDTVVVTGTAGSDTIHVTNDARGLAVLGLPAAVHIRGSESTDQLTINAGAGDDVVEASTLPPRTIHLTANGGDGDDILIGSAGNDKLLGAAGNDILIGNGGQDILDGGTGENTVV